MRKAVPYIVGIGELQRQASFVIKRIRSRHGEGFIVSHNEPKAVLISLERYERLKALENAKSIEEEDVLAIMAKGDREYEKGQTLRLSSLKKLL
jgi:prevent-host-death family protein